MAYDYTKDPNWIKFEAEQRIKRENEERENVNIEYLVEEEMRPTQENFVI